MSRLWKKAVGAVKDHNNLWRARLGGRTPLRNPDIDKAVIRSTAHSGLSFDRRNVDRVLEWIRISPHNLRPALSSVAARAGRTRDWLVALKSLHLMHNVANSRLPCVRRVGRLPFDFSDFVDGHSPLSDSWPFNSFVRAYYAFLDSKFAFLLDTDPEQSHEDHHHTMMNALINLQKQQALIDLLMQIRPQGRSVFVPIILDVMEGIIIEIYDIYSRICRGIAIVLMNIYSAGKTEAKIAVEVMKKATQQGEDLAYFFDFCQDLGCFHASEFPIVDKIPEEGIRELEQIIKGFDEYMDKEIIVIEDGKCQGGMMVELYSPVGTTVITDKWEKFDDEDGEIDDVKNGKDITIINPFGSPLKNDYEKVGEKKVQELPDLITFL